MLFWHESHGNGGGPGGGEKIRVWEAFEVLYHIYIFLRGGVCVCTGDLKRRGGGGDLKREERV